MLVFKITPEASFPLSLLPHHFLLRYNIWGDKLQAILIHVLLPIRLAQDVAGSVLLLRIIEVMGVMSVMSINRM